MKPLLCVLLIVLATAPSAQSTSASLPASVIPPPAGKGVPRTEVTLDFAASGYVQEEFLISGKANVYQYDPAGAVVVKTPDMNYTTRILVRRPANRARFNGIVYFETSHPQYGIDFVWSRTTDAVISQGAALVSVAMRRGQPSAIEAIKTFDPVRYAPINFTEDGLNWDVAGQVGRLLRTKTALNPLNGYDVKRMYAVGWSGGGALLLIYISDGFHERARMPGGGPIFDGYLVGEPSGYPKINSTAASLPNADPRQRVRAIDVPAISLHTRPQEQYRRRADGDQRSDRYRVYEIAGAAHNNVRLPLLSRQSVEAFGEAGCAHERSRFPMHHFFKSTLARLDAWAARGVTPPPSQRIALKADGTPMLDMHGNPAGGVRSTYVDVPTARHFANAPAPGSSACTLDGAQEPFTRETLARLYRNHAGYTDGVVRRAKELERDGWLLPADARELRDEAGKFGGI